MDLVLLATVVTSVFAAVFTFLATHDRLLMSIAFAYPSAFSLSAWVVYKLTGAGPSNFIPNWVAGAMMLFPFLFWIFWAWATEEYKEEEQ